MKFIILGLGNFGKALAVRLTELGHETIGVDNNMQKVSQLKDRITHTVCMDCTDRSAVSSLPLKDCDAVVVAIGEDEASSLLATALLKQLHVKKIIGRVVSDLQRTVLEAMQIEEFFMPEEESADRLAMRLDNSGIVDSFKISEKYSIIETKVPERYIGMTLAQADLTKRYNVIVLTVLTLSKGSEDGLAKIFRRASGIATPDTVLRQDEVLVLFGELSDIERLMH
ncbi:potassium channel family protein [Dyadobacter sandarakinus]|uniref:TrkA family potassium uptake protein n=1 Tax=Dyadobacter sandarakinus TaxID=2747268 RepID=A0ABX7I425_9BACT|nr:TrkA family potassium uptake protein [Dyadobacter sandarakinus]QRR00827.1 TrkA family potassium uptake protein [Dyadobacter sandarakinus]